MRYRAFLLLILLLILLAASTSSPAMALLVLKNWLRSALPLAPLSLAAALIISCGQIDIASGAAFSFVGMIVVAWTHAYGSEGTAVAWLIGWSAVVVFYFLMYFIVVVGRVPALLCTIGMALAGQSISLLLQAYVNRSAVSLPGSQQSGGLTVPLTGLGAFDFSGVWTILIVGLLVLWRYRSNAGLDHIAVGMDPRAARIAGINTKVIYLSAFIASGILVGLSSLLFMVGVQLGGWATNVGWGKELFAIAAAVIGGCRITGGRFDPVCILLATVLVFGVRDITNALNLPLELDYLVLGTGVILVALIDRGRPSADLRA